MKKIQAGVIGASGYAGAELVRLLWNHPMVEVSGISSKSQFCFPRHRVHGFPGRQHHYRQN